MISCLLAYIVLEMGSVGCSTLHKPVAEGLSSIFLKKETSGQGSGVLGHHGEATGWIWTLHSRGNCHADSKRQGQWPGVPWGTWQLSHGRADSMGSPWESVLSLRSSEDGFHFCLLLSSAILGFHILTCRHRRSLCSLALCCGNKMPGTWKRED